MEQKISDLVSLEGKLNAAVNDVLAEYATVNAKVAGLIDSLVSLKTNVDDVFGGIYDSVTLSDGSVYKGSPARTGERLYVAPAPGTAKTNYPEGSHYKGTVLPDGRQFRGTVLPDGRIKVDATAPDSRVSAPNEISSVGADAMVRIKVSLDNNIQKMRATFHLRETTPAANRPDTQETRFRDESTRSRDESTRSRDESSEAAARSKFPSRPKTISET